MLCVCGPKLIKQFLFIPSHPIPRLSYPPLLIFNLVPSVPARRQQRNLFYDFVVSEKCLCSRKKSYLKQQITTHFISSHISGFLSCSLRVGDGSISEPRSQEQDLCVTAKMKRRRWIEAKRGRRRRMWWQRPTRVRLVWEKGVRVPFISFILVGSLISHSVDTIFIIYCNKEQQHLHCCCCSFAPSLAEKEDIDCSKVRTWGSDLETHGK